MAKRRQKAPKEKKLKAVQFRPIEREHGGKVTEPYKILDTLVAKHHKDLLEAEANILIGWDLGPAKPDCDGFIKFGRVRKGSDVDRATAGYDILLVIRQEVFNSFDSTRKHAEIDRLLCRCAVQRDAHGEIVSDEKGRSVFRLRKPVEVFPENVARYGFHQEPKLAECLTRYNDSQRPLLKDDKPKRASRKASEPALAPGEEVPSSHLRNGRNGKTNGEAKAPEPGSLDALDMPYPIVELCQASDLRTVEDVVKFREEYGELGLAELKGMGSERADVLWSAVEKYQAEHAEAAGK